MSQTHAGNAGKTISHVIKMVLTFGAIGSVSAVLVAGAFVASSSPDLRESISQRMTLPANTQYNGAATTSTASGVSGNAPQAVTQATEQITPPQPAPAPEYPKLVRVLGLTPTRQHDAVGSDSSGESLTGHVTQDDPLILYYNSNPRLGYHVVTSCAPVNNTDKRLIATFAEYNMIELEHKTIRDIIPDDVRNGRLALYMMLGNFSEAGRNETFYVLSKTTQGETWLLQCSAVGACSIANNGSVSDTGERTNKLSVTNWEQAVVVDVEAYHKSYKATNETTELPSTGKPNQIPMKRV